MPQKPAVRTWGTRFDTLPSSPPASPQTHEVSLAEENAPINLANNIDASTAKKMDKTPHDASVFVGSLPTNMDQSELSRLLTAHLSEHAEVKNVKLVKDSKGGVCAFVQCENAAAASSLIHTLQSNAQKPFLGRVLRYEPARAFRTLLISYRTPVQFIPSGDHNGAGETIQLDPPHAMRLWRTRNSKYLSILYNSEAVDMENHANVVRDHINEPSLFLQPVVFDETTVRRLCAHFGPLETFGAIKFCDASAEPENNSCISYPPPHNVPRLPQQDKNVFEVKFAYRDDCVSALMTLRRVPHLVVTWAHQPPPYGFDHQQGRFHPIHIQNTPLRHESHMQSVSSVAAVSAPRPSLHEDNPLSMAASADDWKRISAGVPTQIYDSSASFRGTGMVDEGSQVEWTEMDFPPLGDGKADRRAEQGVWVDKKMPKGSEVEARERPPSSLSVVVADANHTDFNDPAPHQEQEQELDMPDTPGLGMSPITPKTSGSQFPTTPTSANGELQNSSFQSYETKDFDGEPKDIDPTSLFVGGLEMFGPDAWDEDRVSAFFGRFGGLQSVKVVRPMNARAAFAFVKFDNTESPARAIFQEHNRVHGGRAMRVQLKDCNPPRNSNFRFNGRGRGRVSQHGSQRRYPGSAEQSHEGSNLDLNHDEYTATEEIANISRLSLADNSGKQVAESGMEAPEFPTISSVPEERQKVLGALDIKTRSCPTSRRATPELPSALDAQTQPEYREWYDSEPASATMTPPLPSPNSVAPVPGAPSYPMPNGGYYPPPWTPYPQQMPYGVQYYPGYAGYPIQGTQAQAQTQPPTQPYSSPGGSDASGPASGPPRPWPTMGMYGGYIPYPAYRRPPNVEKSPRSQAPLQPTGFIQNEQGTLIPVYQPEALDQYMASNQATPTTTSPVQSPNGVSTWQQYPPPPSYVAFPNPMPAPMMGVPPRGFAPQPQASVNGGWVPPTQLQPPPAISHPAPPTNAPNHPANFRVGFQEVGAQMSPHGRRPGRRDQHANHHANGPNNNRNSSQRGMQGRHPRGGMHHVEYPPHGHGEGLPQMQMQIQQQHLARPLPQFNSAPSSDRGQWTPVR